MPDGARTRNAGALTLASTYFASFPSTARPTQERELASLERVCDDGALNVRVEQNAREQLVVRAWGELDIASAKLLSDELRAAIDSDASAIVLDLNGVSFIDSTGLRALVMAAANSRSNGDRLGMRCGSAALQKALKVSGLERSLPLID
jgi:anti-sigma B factor antagonist